VEVDGALTDLHIDGHRVAFNNAFKDLGVDCSNWTAPVYNHLMSQGDGTGEGMVRTFFSRVGWPTFLPTKEEDLFTRKVHQLKQEQLKKLIQKRKVPPRQDVDKVLSDALAAGAKVACISETLSQPSDEVCTSILDQLPHELASQIKVYSSALHAEPEALDNNSSSSNSEAVATHASTQRQQQQQQQKDAVP